jgi:hypothetical protein
MTRKEKPRFEVVIEKGSPRGDLYELEQQSTYKVLDRHSNEVVLVYEELMEASLSTDDGQWGNYLFTGVKEILVADDDETVSIRYHDGQEDIIPLPQ